MLINRLYKSKNNPSNNKHLPKAEETNLLFYQTKKKSFREEETKKVLPLLAKRPSLHEEIPQDRSLLSARRTSRGPFSSKEIKEQTETLPVRKASLRQAGKI